MGKKYFRGETVPSSPAQTMRFGTQNTLRDTKEVGKFVKLSGDSGCVLCALGDPIDGRISSVDAAPADGWTIVGVQRRDDMIVTADGSQAAGTGNLAVGDFVVCGTVVAEGTALPATGTTLAKVRKATAQPTAGADVAAVNAALTYMLGGAWKVVSLLGGNGSPGTNVLIERAFLAN